MSRTYIGDIGTDIILDAGTNISTQTTLKIQYEKPDGEIGEWSASVYDTNYAKYTTQADDLDQAGVWKFRIYIVLPSWTGHGAVDTHEVFELGW